jgi:hypothetical protein
MNDQEEILKARAEFDERENQEKEAAQRNKVFAVFMGAALMTPEDCEQEKIDYSADIFRYKDGEKPDGIFSLWHVDNMKYHKSWDWLMQVCKKIQKMNREIYDGNRYSGVLTSRMIISLMEMNKERTVEECLIFINWTENKS